MSETMADLPPEESDYPDLGCELAPACLTCPFPRCRYDEPAPRRNSAKLTRNGEILRLHQREGKSISELARRFGLSKRSIHRILRRAANE